MKVRKIVRNVGNTRSIRKDRESIRKDRKGVMKARIGIGKEGGPVCNSKFNPLFNPAQVR